MQFYVFCNVQYMTIAPILLFYVHASIENLRPPAAGDIIIAENNIA